MIKIINKYTGAVIYEAEFSNLARVIEVAVRRKVFFTAARLKEVCLDGADLAEGKFQRANLKDSSLEKVNAAHAVFDQACLKRTNFRGSNLKNASFRGANLEGAILDGCDLKDADFTGACMEWVSFKDAIFENTIFKNANLGGTSIENDQKKMMVVRETLLYQTSKVPDRSHGRYKFLVEDFKRGEWDGLPLVVQQHRLLCGTHRFNAAKEAGWSNDDIPVIELAEIFREAGLDMGEVYADYGCPIIATDRWNVFLCVLPIEIRRKYDLYKGAAGKDNEPVKEGKYLSIHYERKLIPPHEVTDPEKYERLKKSIAADGWQGVPLIVHQDILLSGSHRYQAVKDLGWDDGDIPVMELWDVFREVGLNFYALHKRRGKPQVRNNAPWNNFMTEELHYEMRLKYGLKLTPDEKAKLAAEGEEC